jgi:RNA polymerase sigma-70 factor (ECF subfamily)
MFRVCKNLWVDYHRKNKRLSGVKIEDLDITDKNDFIEGIIRDGRAKAVYKAVLSLAEPYKESIILFYYLDMKQNEIAKILGISDGAARTIIYRARKMLKELLEGVI